MESTEFAWRRDFGSGILRNYGVDNAFCWGFDSSYLGQGRTLKDGVNDKLVVFGIPRSGNSWLCRLLSHILKASLIDPYAQEKLGGVGMCHRTLDEEIAARGDFKQAVCLVRDLRDVAASYFVYYERQWKSKATRMPSPESFYYSYLRPRLVYLYDAENFALKYSLTGIPVVRYEDLSESTEFALRDLLFWMGLDAKEDQVRAAIDASKPLRGDESISMGGDLINASHFGLGMVGNWQTVIGSDLGAVISRDFSAHQEAWGYE